MGGGSADKAEENCTPSQQYTELIHKVTELQIHARQQAHRQAGKAGIGVALLPHGTEAEEAVPAA